MPHTIAEIAASLGADAFGDVSFQINGLSEPATAGPDDLALAASEAYAAHLGTGQARAALLWPGADWQALGLVAAVVPKRARFAMSDLTRVMDPGQAYGDGIHPTALIDPSATLGADVYVGAYTIVGPRAHLGNGCRIGPQCYIGAGSVLGEGSYLREQVSIGANVRTGARFIAQPGARIGGDGFSFVTQEQSGVEAARASLGEEPQEAKDQPWHRIHSLGGVELGDDVEIGANSCIDSGTIRPTRVSHGTKLDNHVHIGHNCVVGRNCLFCGQVGIAGSVTIGNSVVLGGQVGVSDNITIGDNVVAGGSSIILSNVPAGRAILGYPATKMDNQLESYKAIRRLPRLLKDVAALKKAVFKSPGSD